MGDIPEAVDFITSLPAAIQDADQIPLEVEDLDDAERAKINKLLDQYDIPAEKKGEAYKHFVQGVLHVVQGVMIWD